MKIRASEIQTSELCVSQGLSVVIYSRASHNADFGDKKNQCTSKTVYCGLLGYYIGTSKIRVSAKFLHTVYTIKSVWIEFLELVKNRVSGKSVLKEAIYNEALL